MRVRPHDQVGPGVYKLVGLALLRGIGHGLVLLPPVGKDDYPVAAGLDISHLCNNLGCRSVVEAVVAHEAYGLAAQHHLRREIADIVWVAEGLYAPAL